MPALDAAQRRVVEHAGGPLLVLAGPGTGKTTTLVEAAVARVEAGVPVEQILMLTFSRRAAGELRDRVTARLGRTVREPIARTLALLRVRRAARWPTCAQGLPAPRLLVRARAGRHAARAARRRATRRRWPAELRPALRTRAFAGELRDLLMRAVERGLDGPALAALGPGARACRLGRGRRVPRRVPRRHLAGPARRLRPGRADPLRARRLRRRPASCSPPSGRGGGTSSSTSTRTPTRPRPSCSPLLAEGADELILVGDPDQSIYAFRGADESAIRDVDERFGRGAPVPVVALRRVAPQPARCCSPRPAGSPTGCPGGPSSAACAGAADRRRRGRGRRCSAPRARRPPTSPACCARRTSTACRGRAWRCWSARPAPCSARCAAR